MLGPLALRPCALLRAWGFQHIPFIACRILGAFACCNQNQIFFVNRNRNARNFVAWFFAVIGGSATIKPRFMRSPFFAGTPFEGPGWTGGTCPGTISLAHVLRGSCARGSFGQTRFSHKTLYSGFPGQKNKKPAFYDQSTHPKEQFSIRHVTSLVNKQDTSWRQMLQPISKVTNVQGKKEGYDTNNQLDTYMIFVYIVWWYGMSCAHRCALLRDPAFLMPLYHALKILSATNRWRKGRFFLNKSSDR